MTTKRGYFAIGIEHTKTAYNVGTLWRSANILGAAFIYTVNRRYRRQASDTLKSWKHIPLINFKDMDDMYSHIPHDCMLVGVELIDNAIDIQRYSHPERAVYLLGAEDHGLTKEAVRRCHSIVRLPGRFSMNVAAAGTIVMYDRLTKALS